MVRRPRAVNFSMNYSVKKFIFALAVFAGCFFMIGFVRKYHLPRIKQWVTVEIDQFSRRNLPVRIWPETVRFNLFPLGMSFFDVKLTPQKGLEKNVLPLTVKEVNLSLSGFGLLKGQLRLGTIEVRGAEVRAFIK